MIIKKYWCDKNKKINKRLFGMCSDVVKLPVENKKCKKGKKNNSSCNNSCSYTAHYYSLDLTFSQQSGLTFPPTHTHLHGSVGVRLPHVCERVCACVFETCQTEQEVMCSSSRLWDWESLQPAFYKESVNANNVRRRNVKHAIIWKTALLFKLLYRFKHSIQWTVCFTC